MRKVNEGSRWRQGFEQPPSLEALKSRVEEALRNMGLTGREKQSARNAHAALLRPSLVGALPAVGAEQEEEAELPCDCKDQDRQLQLELPGAPESLPVAEAPPEATKSQCSDIEKDTERLRKELETVKAEDQDRQLQLELPGAPESLPVAEAPPEATKSQCSDIEKDAERLRKELETVKAELKELSQHLEMESEKGRQREAQICDLREALSALRVSHEELQKSNGQLQKAVAYLKGLLKTYNTQATSLGSQDLMRFPPCASLRKNLTHRSRGANSEEEDVREKTPQKHTFPDESIQARLESYKHYYLEEVNLRRCLEKDLQIARQRLTEANAKLYWKHH
ncbi:cingulin-like [Oxyura jamaicensis]|uniref:cingulin-like n=1 Tax=Oxyura jamaicensis TaxID=8884 RepID=UPI0015A6BC48|nr:cingulin-like [Oxyura jamaicensis]